MDNTSGYISLGPQKLHYIKSGNGSKALIAFHGYGGDARLLLPIAAYLNDVFTVYSIGGRVCLKIAEQVPECIDKVVLIASDGLAFNPFYYFVTRTTPGKFLFSSFLTNPLKYMPVVEWAKKRNLVDGSRYKFAMQYLKAEQDRTFLLKVWPCMAHIIPDYKRLKHAVDIHQIPIHLFMGAYDKVIPISLAYRFCDDIPNTSLHIIEKGHRVFDQDTMPQIAQCFF